MVRVNVPGGLSWGRTGIGLRRVLVYIAGKYWRYIGYFENSHMYSILMENVRGGK